MIVSEIPVDEWAKNHFYRHETILCYAGKQAARHPKKHGLVVTRFCSYLAETKRLLSFVNKSADFHLSECHKHIG